MSGALDTALRAIAKQVVSDLGTALNTTITYSVNKKGSYDIAIGKQLIQTTNYTNIKVPIEFIQTEQVDSRELRLAKLYITPDLIGNHQPTVNDEIILNYGGGEKVAQIVDIDTKRGGQVYLHTIQVRF